MKLEHFEREVASAAERMAALRSNVGALPSQQQEQMAAAFEELQTTIEELWVAQEELRQQNEALEESRLEETAAHDRYQDLFDSAPDGYVLTDTEGTIRQANRAASRLFHRAQDYLPGKPLSVLLASESRRSFRRKLLQLVRGEPVSAWELRLQAKRREGLDVEVSVTGVLGPDGKVTGLRWLLRDITARKRAEAQIHALNEQLEERVRERTAELEAALTAQRETEARLRRLMESNVIGIFFGDLNGRIWDANDAFLDLLGYTREELCAGRLRREELTPPEYHPLDQWAAEEMRRAGSCTPYEKDYQAKDGRRVPVLVGGALLEGSDENDVRFVVDLRALKQAEEELARRQADIEALNEHLQRAMTETHHRVKNNLQIIAALVDMQVGDGAEMLPADEFRRLGAYVRTLATVHDLLTQETKKDAQGQALSVKEILEKLLPMMQQSAPNRPIRYRLEEARISTRQGASLALVVNELVSNALKHGRGAVEVELSVQEGKAILEICDDGPGFPEDFDPAQATSTGMEIVQNLTRLDLRGKVRFENLPQGGAKAIVTLPVLST